MAQTLVAGAFTNPFPEPVAVAPTAGARTAQGESRRQRAAVATLTQSHERLLRDVKAAERRAETRTRSLRRRLAATERHADRVAERSRLQVAYAREARLDASRLRDRVQALETDAQLHQWAGIVNILQSTAFGDSGSLTTTNNLLLLGNQFAWSAVDPVMRSLKLHSGPSPSLLKWLAPIGTLVTGHLLLANRQHVRFVSGTTSVTPGTPADESLRSRIAEGLWPAFQRRTDVPVTVVPLDPDAPPMSGLVRDGILRITVSPLVPPGIGAAVFIPPPVSTAAGSGRVDDRHRSGPWLSIRWHGSDEWSAAWS